VIKTYNTYIPKNNTPLDILARDLRRQQLYKSIGIIETVAPMGNVVYAVIRRESFNSERGDDDLSPPLYNNPMNRPENTLSLLELLLPIKNIDLSISQINPDNLIGYKVEVVENESTIIEVNLIPVSVNSPVKLELTIQDRIKASNLYKEDPLRQYFGRLGMQDSEIDEYLKIPYNETAGKVVLFEGESYWHKDTSKLRDSEKQYTLASILTNLKGLPMKSKDCHRPVRLFGAL
jgi:hypothetical protein